MMFFPLLWILLFFSSAHAVFQYTLDSIENTKVTLNNQAVFRMHFFNQQAVSDWTMGDVLEIFNVFPASLFLIHNQLREGLPIIVPIVRIKNITRNSEMRGRLISMPALGTLTIFSIDLLSHSVTLSDATNWSISPEDEQLLNLWNVNDYILIGQNSGLQSSVFESILLNANQQALIRAQQQ